VLFKRIGPYHNARLRAAGRLGAITAIELEPDDTTYAWNKVDADSGYTRLQLHAARGSGWRENSQRLGQLLDSVDAAAVAIPGYSEPLALFALSWCKFKSRTAILLSESTRVDARRRWLAELAKSLIVRQFDTALVGGSRHVEYASYLGLDPERIYQGYDAVDNEYFSNSCSELRGEAPNHALAPEPAPVRAAKYILASSRFIPKKNLATLLKAFSLFKTGPRASWKLILLGDGPLRAEIEKFILANGLTNEVILPGFVQYQDLPHYYARSEFFVHASTTEQWGLVVNEALASSLPVLVSTPCGCAPDLVIEGMNGFTFDPESPSDLALHMSKLADLDTAKRRQMGAFGQQLITKYSPQVFAENLWKCAKTGSVAPSGATLAAAGGIRALSRFITAGRAIKQRTFL
jgi:glycosyltransferase involved in cell wall biosynthesis